VNHGRQAELPGLTKPPQPTDVYSSKYVLGKSATLVSRNIMLEDNIKQKSKANFEVASVVLHGSIPLTWAKACGVIGKIFEASE
jgi:hypothetical protein